MTKGIHSVGRTGQNEFPQLFTSFSSFQAGYDSFQEFWIPFWMLRKACSRRYVYQVSPVKSTSCLELWKRFYERKPFQVSALRVDSHEWHKTWEKLGQYWRTSLLWRFGSSPLRNYRTLIRWQYLQGDCCGSSGEEQLIPLCWILATLYWTLFNTRQHS